MMTESIGWIIFRVQLLESSTYKKSGQNSIGLIMFSAYPSKNSQQNFLTSSYLILASIPQRLISYRLTSYSLYDISYSIIQTLIYCSHHIVQSQEYTAENISPILQTITRFYYCCKVQISMCLAANCLTVQPRKL